MAATVLNNARPSWPYLEWLEKQDLDLCIEAVRAHHVSVPFIEASQELQWGVNPDV